jgi:hypothetical protein
LLPAENEAVLTSRAVLGIVKKKEVPCRYLESNPCFSVVSPLNHCMTQVKVKFTLEQAKKAQRGSREDIALFFP